MSKNNSSFGRLNVLKLLAERDGRVCFLGVGGVSMSSLLSLSTYFGVRTAGFDRSDGEFIKELVASGVCVKIGEGELPPDTKLLVYTLAIDESDPIIRAAEERKIPCVSRAEYMSALADAYKTKIAVSGSHGKSTVTAMLHSIFYSAGLNPTTLSGARLACNCPAYHVGSLDYFIYEACEYKDSFLAFEPTLALFLNLEYDHVDYFESVEHLEESFLRAARKSGLAIINVDDGKLRKISQKLYTPPITVGKNADSEYRYEPFYDSDSRLSARFFKKESYLGDITLNIIGEFNVLNAAMACVAALECEIDFMTCQRALLSFRGIPTRLEKKGVWRGREVYFDYAHHPTEIKEGIKAIKNYTGNDLTVIFGPHTFSRTKALMDDFVSSLSCADNLFITEIDAVREEKDESITSSLLADRTNGTVIHTASELEYELSKSTGAIAVMGAADLGWVKKIFF